MNKHLAPVALSVGLLGIVGGVAVAHAFAPAAKPSQVHLVQPASVVVTPSPTSTTVAPKPVVRVAPKPAPVQSVKRVAAVAPVQRQASVATPTDTVTAQVPAPSNLPPVIMPAGPTGEQKPVVHGPAPEPTHS
jgi:hypothetical protein